MWILKWLPDWLFYAVLLIGVVGYFASHFIKFIPIINTYRMPVQLASIGLIVIGTFMSGAIHDNNAWKSRVEEMQAKVAKAEEESKEANEKINDKSKQKMDNNKQKQIVVKQYIDREITKYDKTCVIPKEFVDAHNQSAEPPK
jgi:uncharacterized membrane protein (DUF106 family)